MLPRQLTILLWDWHADGSHENLESPESEIS